MAAFSRPPSCSDAAANPRRRLVGNRAFGPPGFEATGHCSGGRKCLVLPFGFLLALPFQEQFTCLGVTARTCPFLLAQLDKRQLRAVSIACNLAVPGKSLTISTSVPKIMRLPQVHFPILDVLMNEEALAFARVLRKDPRYAPDAYFFVREALGFAADNLELRQCNCGENSDNKSALLEACEHAADEDGQLSDEPNAPESGSRRPSHVTGQQLCEGIRQYALAQFGLMAKVVLNSWGVYSTSDFGEIVYNLIKVGVLKKSPRDRRAHFDGVYDFDEAFSSEEAVSTAFPAKLASLR